MECGRLKRIEIKAIEKAGFIWAHECPDASCSAAKRKLFDVERKMAHRFEHGEYHRNYDTNSLVNKLVAANPFSSDKTWLRGFVIEKRRGRSDTVFKVHLIDYCSQDFIQSDAIRPLSSDFDTSIVECQSMKIVLYGIVPVFLKLDLVKENKLSEIWQFEDKDWKYLNDTLQTADEVYFEEVCRVEEFFFGHIYFKRKEEEFNIQQLLIQSEHAVECVNFESKIPEYIKNFRRRASTFDRDLAVRRLLFPKIKFSDVDPASTTCNQNEDTEVNLMSLTTEPTWCNLHSTGGKSSQSVRDEIADKKFRASQSILQQQDAIDRSSAHDDFDFRFHDRILNIEFASNRHFESVNNLTDLSLDSKTFQMLVRLELSDLTRCQKYVIPAILSGQNVVLVDGPGTGKTSGVLIAVISLMRKYCEQESKGVGARTIIVCPYSSHCEKIQEVCLQVIQGRKYVGDVSGDDVKVNVAYGLGTELEKKNLVRHFFKLLIDVQDKPITLCLYHIQPTLKKDHIELSEGYDIIVCTPRRLLRLLGKEVAFDFRRLSLIVFDDMPSLMSSYGKEIENILAHVKRKHKLPQRVIISNRWTPVLKPFVNEEISLKLGCFLVSGYLDAALYVHLTSSWRFTVDKEKKLKDIIDILNEETKMRSVVVVFKQEDNIGSIYNIIKKRVSRKMYKIENLSGLYLDTVDSWRSDVNSRCYPVLFCSDLTLRELHLYEADCLIHYSLPDSKMFFLFRFSVLLNSLQNIADQLVEQKSIQIHPLRRPATIIWSSEEDIEQFPAIIEIMRQFRAQIPENLKTSLQKILQAKEEKKVFGICPSLKEFGRCLDESRCQFRHIILSVDDAPDPNLPVCGFIKVRIKHVFSATHFVARLLEVADESNIWQLIDKQPHPAVTALKLKNYFDDKRNIKEYINRSIGDIVAVQKKNDFYRVKIIDFKDYEDDEPKHAVIKFIDEGWQDEVLTVDLIQLPESLATIPPALVDLFICNLLPIDEDITWGRIITDIVRERINQFQNNSQVYFVGKIQLVLGRNLWLDFLEGRRVLNSIRDIVPVFSISTTLLSQQLAVYNEHHLPFLLGKCKDAGLLSVNQQRHNSKSDNCQTNFKSKPLKPSSSCHDVLTKSPDFVTRIDEPDLSQEVVKCKPQVEWRQDSVHIFLTISINSDCFVVNLARHGRKTKIYFCARLDQRVYEFDEVLFSAVHDSTYRAYKSGVVICVKMTKLLKGIQWKQLFKTNVGCKWVRLDRNFIDNSDDELLPSSHLTSQNTSPIDSFSNSLVQQNNVCRNPAEFDKLSNSDVDSEDENSDFSAKGYDSDD